jgi:hypothetical protein
MHSIRKQNTKQDYNSHYGERLLVNIYDSPLYFTTRKLHGKNVE